MTIQELAEDIGITTAYLSQLENGHRVHPDPILVIKLTNVLGMTAEETITFYDLYTEISGQISPDIAAYISEHQIVRQAIRTAHDVNASEKDWSCFIEYLKK